MIPTVSQLKKISKSSKAPMSNMVSIVHTLERFGTTVGLDKRTRLAHYIAQLAHESGGFLYDKEIWGNTKAQQRYDIRVDLGNTPARDGDGKLYMGRTGIQITGKANYRAFRDWIRTFLDPQAPDFVKEPNLVNTDPWEGLGPVWYWTTHKLNDYADVNNIEMITIRINGGRNGYDDRIDYFARTCLVFAGMGPTQVKEFQRKQGLASDGIVGPKTRNAFWSEMMKLDNILIGSEGEVK